MPCSECERLEREYKRVVNEISAVVITSFHNIGKKILELHRWQDRRDEVIRLLYQHKKNHPPKRSDSVAI